jgi:hypothetical protein
MRLRIPDALVASLPLRAGTSRAPHQSSRQAFPPAPRFLVALTAAAASSKGRPAPISSGETPHNLQACTPAHYFKSRKNYLSGQSA